MKTINLTRGQVALVDDEDYKWLNQWKWCSHKTPDGGYYAVRAVSVGGKRRDIFMHKVILGIDNTTIKGDHIDRDKLNNQRYNLRKATFSENSRNKGITISNTSGYKGVSKPRSGLYYVSIRYNYKLRHLGSFVDKSKAAKMYDFWARDLHGEFAITNFPGKRVGIRKIVVDNLVQ